jgi:hypothetical protein
VIWSLSYPQVGELRASLSGAYTRFETAKGKVST